MGFKLKNVAKAVAPVTALTTGFLSKNTKAISPDIPDVPGFTQEELDFIAQRRALLDEYRTRLNTQPTQYDRTNDQIAEAEQARYLAALNQQQGQLSVSQQQARQAEFERFRNAAGARGIRIVGDDPTTATSTSTAGNQALSEFNKRYALLADEQRRSDLNFGYTANTGRLGLINDRNNAYFANSLNLNNAYGDIQDVYGNQRLTQYERDANQAIYNANARNQTRSNRLGLFNSILGAGATLAGGYMAGGAGRLGMGRAGGVARSLPYSYGGNNATV